MPWLLDGQGAAQDYVGSGIAVATLYSVFGHAAQVYRAPNLVRLRWQVGRSTLTWLMTFVFLATLAFLLKIGAAFSRGQMLVFFTSGVILTALMRLAVARVCTLVISSGALKPNRIILVGLVDQLTGNEALTVLEKYGYAVQRVFPLPTIRDGIFDESIEDPLAGNNPLCPRNEDRRSNRSDTVEFNGFDRRG